ncbi:RidA family protein [Paracraurococcus lichenis]|uniref:RidA family protein n=1 Tax=Paracraurococcus lichenis TaxID=3064888 RepID=A0ABT9E061_9PROT|nr:RidA family protein [Paracraurococcus sp. LOR1-02]MDO9709547.1 RidA family protein [Paracraurococcus sp. LOR1-02]
MEIARFLLPEAPQRVAPFSHAVRAGDFLFVTGQMPTLPGGGMHLVEGGIEAQTRQVVANLQTVLEGCGGEWERTVFARVYLTQFERDYAAMNSVWEASFPPGGLPARTCVGVTALAVGALVEIDLVVAL